MVTDTDTDTKSLKGANEKSRNSIIQAADPYFPHTPWRAVLLAVTLALTVLGFAAAISVVFDVGTVSLFHVVWFFVQGAVVASVGYFGRGGRVRNLETQGRIPKEENL